MKKSFYSFMLAAMVLLVGLNSCFKDNDDEDKVVGSISGSVIDSQTGYGMEGVRVSLTTDLNATNGDNAVATGYTDGDGDYFITEVEVGTYLLIIDAEGYFIRIVGTVVIVENTTTTVEEQTIVEAPEAGSFRIVLNWGESPSDLDSHITGPLSGGGIFHVYYITDYSSDYNVDLDVDDVSSYGPETITIHEFLDGTYRYSVHNFSEQSTNGGQGIHDSPTRVEVYDADGLIQSFNAPAFTGTGNTWRVFEMNVSGNSKTIVPVNTYIYAEDEDDAANFKTAGQKPAMSSNGF